MATIESVAKVMAVMAEVYRVELTKPLVKTYHALLADIDDGILSVAAQAWMAKSQWFPKPAEWRGEALDLTKPNYPTADEAWALVLRRAETHGAYYPPEFEHPIIAAAAQLTGWRDICYTDYNQLHYVRMRFERIYESLVTRDENERRMLPAVRDERGALRVGEAARLLAGKMKTDKED